MRFMTLLVLQLAAINAHAAVINIDFEDRTPDGWLTGFGPVIDSGFALNYPLIGVAEWAGDTGTSNVVDFCTTTACLGDGPTEPLVINSVNAYNFDLLSLDIGTLDLGVSDFVFTGNYAAGGTVQKSVSLTSEIATDGGTLTNVSFDATWAELSSVEISFVKGTGFEVGVLDNITVEAVPVPAAVWLFGSALGGLGWLRRRQTNSSQE